MTVPPKILGNTALQNFDVIVIGSGAGGASIAAILCQLGKKVLILEAGPNYLLGLDAADSTKLGSVFSNDELKMVRRKLIMPDPLIEPRTFRTSPSDSATSADDVNYLPKTVGGGAVHADFKTPRLAAFDFNLGMLQGGPGLGNTNFADWPVKYQDLVPFYEHVETMIGVQGPDSDFVSKSTGNAPGGILRTNGYPVPPGPAMYGSQLAFTAAQGQGYTPFPFPAGIISQDYDGRPACVDCGFCGNYGCPINAKSSPGVTALRKALLTNNCLLLAETRVVRLLYNGTKDTITGVSAIPPDGCDPTRYTIYTADAYVLAASPIESARLLFLSDATGGLGNSSGQVGQNLMFHYQTVVAGVFEQRLHPYKGRSVTHGMADFRGDPNDRTNRPLGGLVEFGVSIEPILEATIYMEQMGIRGTELWKLLKASPLRDRLMTFTMHGEDAPQRSNCVDLDKNVHDIDGLLVPRVTYSNHAFEVNAGTFYRDKLMSLMGAAGAKYGFVAPPPATPNTRHVMGTLRFGTDPTRSVCRADGRFHDIGNLYASDGSLFPTSSGCNPTLTIMALATRIGAQMVFPDNPENGLPASPSL
jgi:gluconate 2-dehydrogenase alpha chain